MEEAMTQSDAEHGEPVGEPEAGDQHVRLTKEEDVTDYLGQLLEQLRHVEDNINKFAIQNYAASGAVVEIAPELSGHGLPLSKCEAYNRVYDQFYQSR